MRTLLLTIALVCVLPHVVAQPYTGLFCPDNTINLVRDNPAFAISDDRAQLSAFSVAANVGGNSFIFKKSVFKIVDSGSVQMGKDFTRTYPTTNKNFYGNEEIMGPAASFLFRKKWFFAVSTGVRYMVNSDNLDDKVFRMLGVDGRQDTAKSDTVRIKNYNLTGQSFSELNLSYAGFFIETEDLKLEAGATLKILFGQGAVGLGIPNASFRSNPSDGVAYGAQGTAHIAFTPYANNWALTNNPFRSLSNPTNNMGLGLDMGMVLYLNPNETMMRKKGYLARFAISITDLGSIKYSASSTSGTYDVNNKNIDYRSIQNNKDVTFGNRIFNGYLIDTVAVPKSSYSKFKVGLPTALHANVDLKVMEHFFINANLLLNLRTPSSEMFANHYITTVSITPRYFYKQYGIGLPFSFNALNQSYVGLVLYAGPVYLGSGAAFQTLVTDAMQNVNLYMGCQFRIKPRTLKERDIMML